MRKIEGARGRSMQCGEAQREREREKERERERKKERERERDPIHCNPTSMGSLTVEDL